MVMSARLDITIPMIPGKYYHVFNQGNEKRPIFFEAKNYQYFLMKYHAYMHGYIDTKAYYLLKNRFHLIIQLLSADEIIIQASHSNAIRIDGYWHHHYVKSWLESISKNSGTNIMNDSSSRSYNPTIDTQHVGTLYGLIKENDQLTDPGRPFIHPTSMKEVDFKTQLASYIVCQRLRRFLLSYAKSINKTYDRTGSLFQKTFRRKHLVDTNDILDALLQAQSLCDEHESVRSLNFDISTLS